MVDEVLIEAMPYLHEAEWAKAVLMRLASKFSSPDKLAEALMSEARQEENPTRRTDLRILAAYLRKVGGRLEASRRGV